MQERSDIIISPSTLISFQMKYLLARSATEYRKEEEPKVYSAKNRKMSLKVDKKGGRPDSLPRFATLSAKSARLCLSRKDKE